MLAKYDLKPKRRVTRPKTTQLQIGVCDVIESKIRHITKFRNHRKGSFGCCFEHPF